MIKQYITLSRIVFIFLMVILLTVSFLSPEYSRFFTYGAIVIMIPFIIYDLISKRKEDKRDGTKHFQLSIYNLLIAAVMMGVFFFHISQD